MEAESRLIQEASRFVRPEEGDGWINISQLAPDGVSTPTAGYDHYVMLDQAWKFYHTNPFAKTIIRSLCKFVLGKGPILKPVSENGKVKDAWDAFAKENKWGVREKEVATRAFRDGEVFLRFIENQESGVLGVRFVRANFIMNPKIMTARPNVSYGIETDPADIEKVLKYYYCDRQGTLKEEIAPDEMMHLKILSDSDMKRGFSFLLTVMPWIKKYESWLEDRIALNKARTAIALVRTVEGPASTVESIRDEYKSQYQDADKHKQQAMPRATVLTASKGISYSMLSPNINATDVRDDGRAILLAVAAGCGFPEMFLTADFSNANYASTMVAQNPFVREIEDWQDLFEDSLYKEVFARVIRHAKAYGEVPQGESEDCSVEWPPLILANITQNNQAREIQHRNKIISKKTWQQKEGLDPATEELNMEEEAGKDVYKGFSMPEAPANQYGNPAVDNPGNRNNPPPEGGKEEGDEE